MATLFWKLSDRETRLEQNITHILKAKPSLATLFENVTSDKSTHFLNLFFPSIPDPITFYVANLSLQDKSAQRINLAIRIPHHSVLSAYLDEHSSLVVIGYWGTRSSTPYFIPESVIISHNNEQPTNYEHELECNFQLLMEGEYPPRDIQNVLTSQLVEELPKISVLANERLEEWRKFLGFKKELIRQKSVGLRYLTINYDEQKHIFKLLAIADSQQDFEIVRRALARKDLQLFDLKTSTDPWNFELPSLEDNRQNKQKVKFELGQFKRGKSAFNLLNPDEVKKIFQHIDLKEAPFDAPIFAWLNIEPTEDWKNKVTNLAPDQSDEDAIKQYKEDIKEMLDAVPSTGFVSFALIGDWSLVDRQDRILRNLKQNENCYAPYLSSYLFDITQAQLPNSLYELSEWFNPSLNEAQKRAVKKMLLAPDLCLIQGPPGTGKTTVIAEAILQLVKQGKTILLSSQSHDAIDNALSRITNHPSLRAIRLAKQGRGRDKITDEGKLFSGEQALARHYEALSHDINARFLMPLQQQQEQIDALKIWLNQSEFLQLDAQKIEQERLSIKEQGIEKRQQQQQANNTFQQQQLEYQAHQQQLAELQQLQDLLSGQSVTPQGLHLPDMMKNIADRLFELDSYQVKLPFQLSDFRFYPESQAQILMALLDVWQKIYRSFEVMEQDITRLKQAGQGGLTSIETQLKVQQLQQEIEQLANQMDLDDREEISNLWRQKRREVTQLKQQSGGLTHECYQLFKDKDQFLNIVHAQSTATLLTERLEQFKYFEQCLNGQITEVNQNLTTQMQEFELNKPDDASIKQIEHEIQALLDQYKTIQLKSQKQKNVVQQHLQKQNFQNIDLSESIKSTQNHISYLQQQYQDTKAQNQNWHGLFEDWVQSLNNPQQPKLDWELISQEYTQNCNLVAISCNENPRTLQDAGIDGFDVVIIDEVSKATPIELLMPLMRARKAILVGDHRQLPPMFQEGQDATETFEDLVDAEDENQDRSSLLTKDNFNRYEKLVTASLFKELFEKAPEELRERLTTQFRMHPNIMKMINYFYDNQLTCGNPDEPREHQIILKSKLNTLVDANKHLLWVDTSNDDKGVAYKDNESTNIIEAKLIAKTLVNINAQMKKHGYHSKNKQKVGVVSFYQSQCRTIRDEIRKENGGKLDFEAIHVEINTVIRYQGKEKPIILISLVRNDGKPKDHKRSSRANIARFEFINVAMSRAQNLLMVFGARNMLELRDVNLPNMDQPGTSKRKIYQDIFNRLDREGQVCSAREFMQANLDIKPQMA
jgi:superfamily I DNA and/or RNA helicase